VQVLDFFTQPDSVASQQHEINRVAAAADFSLHHHFLSARNAVVWRTVRSLSQCLHNAG